MERSGANRNLLGRMPRKRVSSQKPLGPMLLGTAEMEMWMSHTCLLHKWEQPQPQSSQPKSLSGGKVHLDSRITFFKMNSSMYLGCRIGSLLRSHIGSELPTLGALPCQLSGGLFEDWHLAFLAVNSSSPGIRNLEFKLFLLLCLLYKLLLLTATVSFIVL